MESSEPLLRRAAFVLTFASAVAVLFSIAVSQILLTLAFAALLASGIKLKFPPIYWPLGAWILLSIVSIVLADDPGAGKPQLRKFFVYLMLLVVASAFRSLSQVRLLVVVWTVIATAAAVRSLVQFADKVRQAQALGVDFYEYYMTERITGFMSHWMTFGGQEMMVVLLLASLLFFAPHAGKRRIWLLVLCGAILGASLIAGFTRSIWLATAVGGVYLLWFWRKWMIAALPVLAALVLWLGPSSLRARALSIFEPHGEMDSNEHRVATRRIAIKMIAAHPWFGLGPENVKIQYERYIPNDIAKLPGGWYGHLHNIYLHYAAERGIPAMLALMAILGKALFDFWRALRKLRPGPSDARFVLNGAIAVILAILVSGWYELNLGDSEVLMMFLVVLSAGYLAAETSQQQQENVA